MEKMEEEFGCDPADILGDGRTDLSVRIVMKSVKMLLKIP